MKNLSNMLLLAVALFATTGACNTSPASRALDFSLGTWSISSPGQTGKSTSTIRHDIRDCAIIEEWKGAKDVGLNVDAYNSEDGRWHRFFVDSFGKVHVFEGTATNSSIQYEGTSREPDGRVFVNRLTLRSLGPNRMTQLWQKSPDGKTWTTAFEGTYTRVR